MCKSAACVLGPEEAYTAQTDSHEVIRKEHNIRAELAGQPIAVDMEGALLALPATDPVNWTARIEQDLRPAWFEADMEGALQRARVGFARQWFAERVTVRDDGLWAVSGDLHPVDWCVDALTLLTSIGGYAYLCDCTGDLSALQSIGGNADLRDCTGDLSALQSIGGNAYLEGYTGDLSKCKVNGHTYT